MSALKLLLVFALLGMSVMGASAEYTPKGQKAISAIAPAFPHLTFIWAIAEGDLDGDGISDLALVVTGQRGENAPREERLFVLTGNPDGSYRVLSVSDEFCHVSKFYNLDIGKNSVFVQGFGYADAARASSVTLQFRYNAKLKDLELIGEQSLEENYEDGSYYRVSVNYLTKAAIHSRHAEKRHKEAKVRFNNGAILRLQGFDCSNHSLPDSTVYIDKNFKVQDR
ncbi:MAG TPA: hypothetical protein VM532_03565 [Burkholderiales bacterium]|nr:hypothetical protein [Burkholderiales bacterium]